MALPPSWGDWLKAEIDKALPTNTTGTITADAERGLLYKVAEKSDPLPYVNALQTIINEMLWLLAIRRRFRRSRVMWLHCSRRWGGRVRLWLLWSSGWRHWNSQQLKFMSWHVAQGLGSS